MNADMSEWTRFFQTAGKRMGDLTPVHEEIGKHLVPHTRDNFRSSGGRDKWKPLSPNTLTAERRRYGTAPLLKTRDLYNSVTYMAERFFVDVGSNLKQARAQFFGWKNIPARSPFAYMAGVLESVGNMYTAFIFGVR